MTTTAKKERLVTGSIWLFSCEGRYYIQTITDNFHFYHYEVSREEAMKISGDEKIIIESKQSMPRGMHLRQLHFDYKKEQLQQISDKLFPHNTKAKNGKARKK